MNALGLGSRVYIKWTPEPVVPVCCTGVVVEGPVPAGSVGKATVGGVEVDGTFTYTMWRVKTDTDCGWYAEHLLEPIDEDGPGVDVTEGVKDEVVMLTTRFA